MKISNFSLYADIVSEGAIPGGGDTPSVITELKQLRRRRQQERH